MNCYDSVNSQQRNKMGNNDCTPSTVNKVPKRHSLESCDGSRLVKSACGGMKVKEKNRG
jgi:hypothetical protein